MANVEGRGQRAPVGKVVNLSTCELDELRRLGRNRANFRRYEQRKDAWGKGFAMDAAFIGMVGELAVAKCFNSALGSEVLKIDTVDRKFGDPGYDFKIGDLTFDVKANRTNGRPLLVRRVDDKKRIVPLRADAYVLVDAQDVSKPRVMGFAWAGKMHLFARSPHRDAKHCNIIVPREQLNQIGRLIAAVEAQRLQGGVR